MTCPQAASRLVLAECQDEGVGLGGLGEVWGGGEGKPIVACWAPMDHVGPCERYARQARMECCRKLDRAQVRDFPALASASGRQGRTRSLGGSPSLTVVVVVMKVKEHKRAGAHSPGLGSGDALGDMLDDTKRKGKRKSIVGPCCWKGWDVIESESTPLRWRDFNFASNGRTTG